MARYEYWKMGDLRERKHDAIPLPEILELQSVVPNGIPIRDSDGRVSWMLNGKTHRIDGPAYENNSAKYWYLHGKLHREDGPAVEYSDGSMLWYLNDIRYLTQDEYINARNAMKKKSLTKDFVPMPIIMASNAFVKLVNEAKGPVDIEASDLVAALKKCGWDVDVSEAINADGRKGFVLTLLQPAAATTPEPEKVETNVQAVPKIIRKPSNRKFRQRPPF